MINSKQWSCAVSKKLAENKQKVRILHKKICQNDSPRCNFLVIFLRNDSCHRITLEFLRIGESSSGCLLQCLRCKVLNHFPGVIDLGCSDFFLVGNKSDAILPFDSSWSEMNLMRIIHFCQEVLVEFFAFDAFNTERKKRKFKIKTKTFRQLTSGGNKPTQLWGCSRFQSDRRSSPTFQNKLPF